MAASLIQRLLRGRLLYLLLGLLVLLLYTRGVPGGLHDPSEPVAPAQQSRPLEGWSTTIDLRILNEVLVREPHLAMVVSALAVFVLGMGLGGIVLTAWMIGSGRLGKLWRFRAKPLPSWSFGEMGRITILTVLITSLLPFVRLAFVPHHAEPEPDLHLWLTASMLFLDTFVALMILTLAAGKASTPWRAVGLSIRHARVSLEHSFRAYLTVFPWLFVLVFLSAALAHAVGFQPPVEPIQRLLFQEDRPAVLWMTALLACLVGPMAEELFFRGVVYAAVRRRTSRLTAMLVSGGIFALIHTSPIGFVPIMVLGCLLAHLYERTGSLVGPLVIHSFHNSLLLGMAMLYRHLTSLA